MFSKRLLLIFSYRQKYSELLLVTPYTWNMKKQSLSLSSGWRFFAWPAVHVYLLLYEAVTFLRIIVHVWIWKELVNFDKVAFLASIIYADMNAGLVACIILVLMKRRDGVHFANNVLNLDKHFEG